MSARKVCINHPSSYYTGKEQSPLHFGLSAEGYDINSIMEGYDKDLWIVEVRNSKKVWTKKESINKMTYEVPLITESEVSVASIASVSSVASIASAVSVASVSSVASVASVSSVASAVSVASVSSDTSEVDAADAVSVASVSTDLTDTALTDATLTEATDPSEETVGKVAKISKTVKPTDYTLFISYRIQQMKAVSTDNKKNYDTAREEWKEYKKKPDELRDIMRAARHNASSET
jgi:hypothetical protein